MAMGLFFGFFVPNFKTESLHLLNPSPSPLLRYRLQSGDDVIAGLMGP